MLSTISLLCYVGWITLPLHEIMRHATAPKINRQSPESPRIASNPLIYRLLSIFFPKIPSGLIYTYRHRRGGHLQTPATEKLTSGWNTHFVLYQHMIQIDTANFFKAFTKIQGLTKVISICSRVSDRDK